MRRLSLRTFIQNLYSLWVYDYHNDDNRLKSRAEYLETQLEWYILKTDILSHSCSLSGSAELQYVLDMPFKGWVFFPYQQIKRLESVNIEYNEEYHLPFVMHNRKRLFFPANYSIEDCERAYRFLIEQDQVVGGGYMEKAPHCYQTEQFKVKSGDVLVDGGAAEGIFALEMIDEVSHVYLIESDEKWIPALQATFAPYNDKVTIVHKYLSDIDDENNISLASLLSQHTESCFIKMDIEGAEPKVIAGSRDFLKAKDNIRIACCTYHYHDDAQKLSQLFDEIDYQHDFSEGWFFFAEYDKVQAPYLRHALIRARKKNKSL